MRAAVLLSAGLAALAPVALCAANASDDATYTSMASALLEFQNAGLTPDVVPDALLSLGGALQVTFGNVTAPLGGFFDVGGADKDAAKALAQQPALSLNYTPVVAQQQLFWSQLFTVIAFDAGMPLAAQVADGASGASTPAAPANVTRTYISNNNTVVGDAGVLANFTRPLQAWAPLSVPAGSGPHRMVQLVFAQGPDFAPLPAANLSAPGNFSVADYVRATRLGKIVAASYFVVQNGSAIAQGAGSQQPAPTQPVDPAQVAAKATQVAASLLAEGTAGAKLKDASNAAAPRQPIAALAALAAAALAGAAALLA